MKLTATQERILHAAAGRPSGDIEPLPPNVNAGIRQRVIDGLLKRGLIEFKGGCHRISALKKRFGMTIVSHKMDGQPRRYRIVGRERLVSIPMLNKRTGIINPAMKIVGLMLRHRDVPPLAQANASP